MELLKVNNITFSTNNWFKAPSPGEIKIRLFITAILFFPGRGRPHLSTVNCQLSTVNCQLNSTSLAIANFASIIGLKWQ
ncbi:MULTISPECIES: hypothetical protein [unclassified Microcoleus]|uniref:hypothetical protein n=1 Tax=unclassified Microcoleus TaxID=2642155 RepID=UPI0025DF03BF|nr:MULTISPECIES: hypothetical protein [unclassified Microcoleus]